jgi:hypothetical protein
VLFSLAAFLVVLAVLAYQLRVTPHHGRSRPQVIVRRVYQTTVVETVAGPGPSTSVSQSVSSPSYASAPTATTRSS